MSEWCHREEPGAGDEAIQKDPGLLRSAHNDGEAE